MLREFSGAVVRRVIDRSHTHVAAHAHDWPLLTFFVLGGYTNRTELGDTFIASPSALFYRARAAHENTVSANGFEQIEIEFDPRWLGTRLPDDPVARWVGGRMGAETRALIRVCLHEADEKRVRVAVRQFVERASCEPEPVPPSWVSTVNERLRTHIYVSVEDLADEVGLHPSWLGTAYRRATGEGVLQATARLRVEHAARLLRETDQSCAGIAVDAGFCDQSHMNRVFQRVLGRSPLAVREDRRAFRKVEQIISLERLDANC